MSQGVDHIKATSCQSQSRLKWPLGVTLTTQVFLLKRTLLPRPLPVILQVINPRPPGRALHKTTQFHTRDPLPPSFCNLVTECHYLMFTNSLNIFISSVVCDFFATPGTAAWHFHEKWKGSFTGFPMTLSTGILAYSPRRTRACEDKRWATHRAEQPPRRHSS